MFEEEDIYSSKDEIKGNIDRFESMLADNKQYFFDVEDFEDITDHYIEQNSAKKAIEVIEYALNQHPDSSVLLLRKAQLLAALNKPQKSLDLLSKLEMIEPTNVEIHITKANILSQLRQYTKAAEAFKKALENADEDKDDIILNIAFEYTNMGNYDKAIIYLKQALEVNPENESALFELAFCFEITGRSEESIGYYQDFIDKHPYSSSAWFNLGVSYSKLNLYEKAIDAYDFSIAIDENFSSAYFNKANALASMHAFEEAIEVYKETFDHEEPDALAWYYIGECYEKLLMLNKALSAFRKATKLDPFLADAWIGIGMVLDEQGKTNEAVHFLEKGVNLDEKNADYWYILADLQSKRGFIDEAQIAYEKVIEFDKDHQEVYLDYSDMYFKTGDIDTALDLAYRGIKEQASNALLYYRITAYLMEKGYEIDAYDLFEIGLQINYAQKEQLFDYAPELTFDNLIQELIETYKA
ncbi:MAG: tetratricopeptide repeat protein [Bacteroidetes bacterium]|nr:tetratricopeptide repeat protein [Bacteroidota bacterium]